MRVKVISLLLCANLISLYPVTTLSAFAQNVELGNKYAKVGHDFYSKNEYLDAAKNYEKAYGTNKIKVYLDNAITAYTSYAFDLANEKKYDEAIVSCNKVLSLNPNDKNVKELLSDIYYSRGTDYFYTGEMEKAKVDLKKAFESAVLEEQKTKIKEVISKLESYEQKGVTPKPKYEQTSDSSIPESVIMLENKMYGKLQATVPLFDRVKKLEADTLGKTYDSDGLIVRVDRLKRAIMPETVAQANASQSSNDEYEGTYIPEIIDQSMGRVTIIGNTPITVFINDCNVKPYKKFYNEAILAGFREWENASLEKIKFQTINDPSKADITVVWQEDFEDFPWKPELKKTDVADQKERLKYQKAGAAIRIGSIIAMVAGGLVGVPVIGSVGALGNGVASPWLQYKGMNKEKLSPDLKINVKGTENLTEEQVKTRLKMIAIHQMGHALGVFGHSPNPNDIMYENFTATQLSERDIKTIREIYKNKGAEKK